uniref:C2H2-type domain-containing protein n=1 Tax=Caenorhabditis tropicalis TaxID=1561998 RepID=A0A1I7TCC3_9PELO
MTCDDWKTFIQVNIYGQTLQDLNQKGIGEIGCPNVWIGEPIMYNAASSQLCSSNQSFNDVEPELDSMNQVPVLSTTLATGKCPRFSTPAVSQFAVDRKFTLNLPENYSRISSNGEEMLQVTDDNDHDVEKVLNEMIEIISGSGKEKKVVLSTTVTKIGVPRSSTPILSEVNVLETVTLNLHEAISDIESNDDGEVISEQEEARLENKAYLKRKHEEDIKSLTYISARRRRTRRLSAPNLINNVKIVHGSPEPKKKRPALSRSTTQRKLPVPGDISSKAHSFNVDFIGQKMGFQDENEAAVENSPIYYPVETDQEFTDNFVTSMRIEHEEEVMNKSAETKPFPMLGTSEDLYSSGQFEPIVYSDLAVMKTEVSAHEQQNDSAPGHTMSGDVSMNMDYGENEMEGNYFSASEGDETEVMMVEELSQGHFTPPPPGLIKTKIYLERNSKNKRTSKQRKLDETHQIKCHFKDCDKTYAWRSKYGKLRLVDHALTHVPNLELKCELCDHTCKGIRSIRYHHKSGHSGVEMKGFGIRQVVTTQKGIDFANIWETCFKKNPAIRNNGCLIQLERNERGRKQPREPEPKDPVTSTDQQSSDEKPKFQ